MNDRSSICCCLILLGYPFLSIGASTSVMAVGTCTLHILRRACHLRTPYTGLLTSAWAAADTLAKIGGAIVLIVPVCMIPLFLWTQRPLLRQFLPGLCPAHTSMSVGQSATPSEDQEAFILQNGSDRRSSTQAHYLNDRRDMCWCQAVERAGANLVPLLVLLPEEAEGAGLEL